MSRFPTDCAPARVRARVRLKDVLKRELERKRANFDYYDALTTGDPSLSARVQCVIAAEIGDEERALEHFRYALLMDLADVAGNVSDGVHIPAAAGSWMAIVNGFGGVRDYNGRLPLDPHLPSAWQSLEFSLRFRDRQCAAAPTCQPNAALSAHCVPRNAGRSRRLRATATRSA
jgi:trehalose/maltose hydrolase-like predicted phosphorylase